MSILADFSRTCKGCQHVRTEQVPKLDSHRCVGYYNRETLEPAT